MDEKFPSKENIIILDAYIANSIPARPPFLPLRGKLQTGEVRQRLKKSLISGSFEAFAD
ncbi:hypothetical protein [Novosphingobium sp. 9]|uniref:hypothetical protein n=1 Tax=Novosphingobium sp. 9 TaxID=2025349 RepID=UPI0021B51210|nr:hypothetical protein [Novosphingobium sp. 9]